VRFAGKAVLVTGASRGIGRAVASAFAREGARVALHYRERRDAAKEVLASLPGGPHVLVAADLADPRQAERVVEETAGAFGRLDVLVNNAGIWEPHPILTTDFDAWREIWERTLATNLLGPAHLAYFAARRMARSGGGRIVNVSSRGAFRGEPESPAYGASKGGLNAMSQSLAKALGGKGVFVYAVAPGWVETDMAADTLASPAGEAIRRESPLNRVARPEDVANTILFLASEGAEFLTGGIVDVNGASYLRT
jgi:3-oxoacyl-[acyl-carrier protein] reductase